PRPGYRGPRGPRPPPPRPRRAAAGREGDLPPPPERRADLRADRRDPPQPGRDGQDADARRPDEAPQSAGLTAGRLAFADTRRPAPPERGRRPPGGRPMDPCHRHQAQLLDHLYDLLDPADAAALEAHLAACPA